MTPRLKNLTSRDRTQLIRVYPVIHCESTGTGFADLSPTRRHSQPTGRPSVACDQIKLGYESPLCIEAPKWNGENQALGEEFPQPASEFANSEVIPTSDWHVSQSMKGFVRLSRVPYREYFIF
ncbi:unnamed protein product [Aspergillus oryzae RIB40]|uniref:DNA, SC011 n=1 Tax=Aspergillus oryzae (strain ATCC 42149 / RIB 40) TaxID=510516 RepID=Q2TZU0_ASPOR|nr:unnamed protein product [Aspergillus oryzae RIB40]BAE65175.1 unnamed protein product [Aspergillus oryzae RIB40]